MFGLTVSSTWGNGHATLWRALIRALLDLGHQVTFFERDVPYYAEHRDVSALPAGGELCLYENWQQVVPEVRARLQSADVGIITSYCPDARPATKLLLDSKVAVRCFYDLDTPVTLAALEAHENVDYVGPEGFRGFDLVLSYTGGGALDALRERLCASQVAPLYGAVDPDLHQAAEGRAQYRGTLSYLGTYAEDRQPALERLFVAPCRRCRAERFVIAGALYPQSFPWAENMFFVRHLPAAEHPSFYASSRLTLNVTRRAMAQMGWCPSGRLFEAAACGAPILTDCWDGLDSFFTPGQEILVVGTTEEAVAAMHLPDAELRRIAGRAHERTMAEHTALHRAREMVALFESAATT